MALMLRASGILAQVKKFGQSGATRSGLTTATAAGVGLIAGRRSDAKIVPLAALGAGAAASLVGLDTIGTGTMAGGAAILGYKFGAKRQTPAETAAHVSTTAPRPAPKKRGFFHRG